MSRKAFLIWGLGIIHVKATLLAVAMYLSLSKIIGPEAMGPDLIRIQFFVTLTGFGTILFFRFNSIGRRKRILALCLPFYIGSTIAMALFASVYLIDFIGNSGAQERFSQAIGEWARLDDPKPASPWNWKHKIDLILVTLPGHYLINWGLFALLWFGSLDPRKPGKGKLNGLIQTVGRKFKPAQPVIKLGVSHG